jgi:hypothetical protein
MEREDDHLQKRNFRNSSGVLNLLHRREERLMKVVMRAPDISLEQAMEFELIAKTLEEPHPTEVGKIAFLERKTDFLGSFWHVTQSTLLGAFVSQSFGNPNYRCLRSEN